MKSVEEITTEIMGLRLEERARLAELLIVSLDAPSEEENLALWVKEAERRMGELRAGSKRVVPLDEAIDRVRSAVTTQMRFLDRENEMRRLDALVGRHAAGLVAVWGRRRVVG